MECRYVEGGDRNPFFTLLSIRADCFCHIEYCYLEGGAEKDWDPLSHRYLGTNRFPATRYAVSFLRGDRLFEQPLRRPPLTPATRRYRQPC